MGKLLVVLVQPSLSNDVHSQLDLAGVPYTVKYDNLQRLVVQILVVTISNILN